MTNIGVGNPIRALGQYTPSSGHWYLHALGSGINIWIITGRLGVFIGELEHHIRVKGAHRISPISETDLLELSGRAVHESAYSSSSGRGTELHDGESRMVVFCVSQSNNLNNLRKFAAYSIKAGSITIKGSSWSGSTATTYLPVENSISL